VIPLLVVDAANVVGSVPDGWWRDRRGATERLRDTLGDVAWRGIPAQPGPVEVVLVVEGAARGVQSAPLVEVVEAPGEGDDTIVRLVREREPGRPCWVATADRALSRRVLALGAQVVGPRTVR
jgi:hypothetical protein